MENDIYFVLRGKIQTWNEKELFAKLVVDLPYQRYPDLAKGKPIDNFPSHLSFYTPIGAPNLDVFVTMMGVGSELFSDRFIEILNLHKILYEKFKVRIMDENLQVRHNQIYYMINLLCTQPIIDLDKSIFFRDKITKKPVLEKLVLSESCLKSNILLFRMSEAPFEMIVHKDLTELIRESITGCELIPTSDYAHSSIMQKRKIENRREEDYRKNLEKSLKKLEKRHSKK